MRLKDLMECDCDAEITSIAYDARDVKEGSLFFCLKGKADGHDYAMEAVAAGAAALVTERRLDLSVPEVVVADTRKSLALACAAFYRPEKYPVLIAVTGTNGKTTTTYILKSILENAGHLTGVIGTTAVSYGSVSRPATLTTPDPVELYSTIKEMADAGVEFVVMEASAHALYLRKLDGLTFDVAAFTNFSRDHLDYFRTMEAYADAKKLLFSRTRFSVVNVDDALGREIALECGTPLLTYGCNYPADVFAIDLKMSVDGISYVLNLSDDLAEIKFNLPGRFNMYNTLCAAAVARALQIPIKNIAAGIRSLTKVEGRFNIIGTGKCSIIIDFAHTDDGLRNILTTIREFAPKRIITVFGCGGDRDKTKRPLMGKTVCALSDYAVITSDNSRTEAPEAIIRDITAGIEQSNYETEPDRKAAIKRAIGLAEKDDIVLVAGKGAEKYVEVNGVRVPYNDEEYILRLIEVTK